MHVRRKRAASSRNATSSALTNTPRRAIARPLIPGRDLEQVGNAARQVIGNVGIDQPVSWVNANRTAPIGGSLTMPCQDGRSDRPGVERRKSRTGAYSPLALVRPRR